MMLPRPLPNDLVELIARRFRAIGEPMRIRLLDQLRDGEATVGELSEATAASQQNISKHLAVLADAGILGRRKEGNRVYYWIVDEASSPSASRSGALCSPNSPPSPPSSAVRPPDLKGGRDDHQHEHPRQKAPHLRRHTAARPRRVPTRRRADPRDRPLRARRSDARHERNQLLPALHPLPLEHPRPQAARPLKE